MRTTDGHVKAIIATDLNTLPFIQTASRLVDTHLLAAGFSEDLLAEIETWWAAHLVCMREPRETQVKLGETSITYEKGNLGQGLQSTRYGQVVLDLGGEALVAAAS